MSHDDAGPASLHSSPEYGSPHNSASLTLCPHPQQKLYASDSYHLEASNDPGLGWQRKSDSAHF